MDIPQTVRDLIHQVVEQDEGGWVLTHNPNDPDGGWTFGGIIATTWPLGYEDDNSFYHNTTQLREHIEIDLENARVNSVLERKQLWIDRGIEIYYTKFYLPLRHALGRPEAFVVLDCEFSCAVDMGIDDAVAIHKVTERSGRYREDFCKAWMDHYIQLVKKNAEAWRIFAEAGPDSKPYPVKPATLRAEFLHGWFNRVWRYLP